jgi:MoaA/NifB/PqqE/SkfB family radical SAM enzyme
MAFHCPQNQIPPALLRHHHEWHPAGKRRGNDAGLRPRSGESIGGWRGPINDEIRGQGVFEKIERGLNRLIDLKRERNSETPRINLFFTLNAPNHDRLVPFLEWASGKAIQAVTVYHLRFYHEQDYRDHNEFMKDHLGGGASLQSGFVFQPGPIDTGVLCEQIAAAKSRQWPFHLVFQPDHPPDEIPDYYHRVGYRRRAITYCGVPWTCAAIDPSANVIPCIDYVCGNLKEEPFLKIWNGKRFQLFQKSFETGPGSNLPPVLRIIVGFD